MANASGAAVDKLLPVKYVHQRSHVEYDISLIKGKAGEGNSAWLEVKDDTGTGDRTLVYNPGVESVKRLRAELGECKPGSTAAARR